MKIGCGTVLFRKFDLEPSLEAIRKIGYEYFETQAVGPWCPHVDVFRDDPENLVRLKNKFGFKGVTGLWTKDGNLIAGADAVKSTVRSIEWASAAGIPVVHAGDGNKPKDMSDEEAYQRLRDNLAPILEAAEKYKVKLAIEPHGTFSLTLEGLKKIMALGSPEVLGINYDAANIFRSGYVESSLGSSRWREGDGRGDEVTILEGVKDRVIHAHAKDLDEKKNCVPVGEGLVRIKDCVKILSDCGYDGVISVETEGQDRFEDVVELAKKSYEYLNGIIG